jgi:hypothetical protein
MLGVGDGSVLKLPEGVGVDEFVMTATEGTGEAKDEAGLA